jgi:hypothetical protein
VTVALLDVERGAAACSLAGAGLGRLVAHSGPSMLDVPLRARKLGDHLAAAVPGWLALRRDGYELAHAFSPEDALAAAAWPGPLVLTITAPPRRSHIAARRSRLRATLWALSRADVLLAADEATAAGLRRWFAADARVIAGIDAHAALYAEEINRRRGADARARRRPAGPRP